MANKNSEKNSGHNYHPDELDMMIGMHLLQEDIEKQSPLRRNSSSDVSWLEVILYFVGGFFLEFFILYFLGVDSANLPGAVVLILWFVCSIVVMVAVISFGSRKR
ncbi:MAG: hypothetical protein LUG93_16905 [Lachnospiraceae bacterium]|nr:hypothetical protein [Lachnospiraceae bacterium]